MIHLIYFQCFILSSNKLRLGEDLNGEIASNIKIHIQLLEFGQQVLGFKERLMIFEELEGPKTTEAVMVEVEDNDTSSPERDDQTKINKKKFRKRKRPNKREHKQKEKNNVKID